MHKQTATAHRISIEDIAVLVWAYVHADDEELAVLDVNIRVLEIDAACADALDLGAEKLDARLVFFVHEIVVVSLFILRDKLCTALFISQNGHLLYYLALNCVLYNYTTFLCLCQGE